MMLGDTAVFGREIQDKSLQMMHIIGLFGDSFKCDGVQLFARYVDIPRRLLSKVICIDELHVNISRVCNYALVLQDFLTGEPIDLVANRRQEITEPYFASIPNAVTIVDSFHVVKMINDKILGYIRRLQNKYKHMDEQRHERLEQQLGRKIEFTHSKE